MCCRREAAVQTLPLTAAAVQTSALIRLLKSPGKTGWPSIKERELRVIFKKASFTSSSILGGSSTRPTPLQSHLAVSRHILFTLCFAWPGPANPDCYQLLKQQCQPCGKILQIHELVDAFVGLIRKTECPMPAVTCLLLRPPN